MSQEDLYAVFTLTPSEKMTTLMSFLTTSGGFI